MRMYEVKRSEKTIAFARTAGYARDYVREDDPSARKTNNSVYGVDIFTNGMSITLIDIKADKEGVITLLNSVISQPEPVEKPTEQVEVEEGLINEVGLSDAQAQIMADLFRAGTPSTVKPTGIIPATAYDGTGNGTCLHCNKKVGYVGGFPPVNPPEEIRDK